MLSITTISSPHRGSAFADHFLSTVGRERLPSVLSLIDLLPNGGGDGTAFEFLTVENMRLFNESTPDVEGVHYFSWGAVYEPGLIDTWKCVRSFDVRPPGFPRAGCQWMLTQTGSGQVATLGRAREGRAERWFGVGRVGQVGE